MECTLLFYGLKVIYKEEKKVNNRHKMALLLFR